MAPALLTAVDSVNHVHLIVGSSPIASARCSRSVEVGARVIVIAPHEPAPHYALQKKVEDGQIEWLKREFLDDDLSTLGRAEVDNYVDAVFVSLGPKHTTSLHISNLCRRLRIPVNVNDAANLSTFTLLSTYQDGPLQIGITTSGKGCKLASRIRREITATLPPGLGAAVDRLGGMRKQIWEEDHATELNMDIDAVDNGDDTELSATFNKLVTPEDAQAAKSRRIRWLAQICEYWPLQRLASLTDEDVTVALRSFTASDKCGLDTANIDARRQRSHVFLVGSGPGNPDLLTIAAHKAISSAGLVLADKLVPAAVMDLVPRRAEVHIARKFPGNADKAQDELLELGLQGLQAGKIVVRIKQGDPYLYGRGGEELLFFRERGFEASVIPGITSALSAPLFAGIPATHRAVADQVLICTGTGRKGAAPDYPTYIETRTVVLLMALHRLSAVVEALTSESKGWPLETPCAVIERASCRDQRVIRTTLQWICAAVEEEGSRPPGLLVLGKSCQVLSINSQRWIVEDGFHGLDALQLVSSMSQQGLT